MVVSLSFYGMAALEGPIMSIKTVNALSHYTDWTIGHVHSGALGWVAFISIGCLYSLIPRVYHRPLYSQSLVDLHFWIATIGVVIYIASMWVAGIMQGLMWRELTPEGTLAYTFMESINATYPYYVLRWFGGLLFLVGMCIMAYNIYRTLVPSSASESTALAQGGA